MFLQLTKNEWITKMVLFVIGSFVGYTLIAPVSDLDVLIVTSVSIVVADCLVVLSRPLRERRKRHT
jgi:hypothetical protein